jgi:hypothetical protein
VGVWGGGCGGWGVGRCSLCVTMWAVGRATTLTNARLGVGWGVGPPSSPLPSPLQLWLAQGCWVTVLGTAHRVLLDGHTCHPPAHLFFLNHPYHAAPPPVPCPTPQRSSVTLLGALWTLYLVFVSGEGHSALHAGMVEEATHYHWRTSLLDVVVLGSALLGVLLALQRASRGLRRHFKPDTTGGLARAHEPVRACVCERPLYAGPYVGCAWLNLPTPRPHAP